MDQKLLQDLKNFYKYRLLFELQFKLKDLNPIATYSHQYVDLTRDKNGAIWLNVERERYKTISNG